MWPAGRMREMAIRGPLGLRVMIAVATVSVGALLVGVLWAARPGASPSGDTDDLLQVGVVQGQSIPGYLGASRRELAALTDPASPAAGDTWALVSLDTYVPPERLPSTLAGAAVAQVYVRVPMANAHTQVVRLPVFRLPGDVTAGMLDAALQRDQEQAEYLQLSRRLQGDGGDVERARGAYSVAAATAAAEAAAYRSGCACAFAAVVRAAPRWLQAIADRPGVRVVDPAPEIRGLDRTEFCPPLPEQSGVVAEDTTGSATPVPTDGSGIASHTAAPLLSSLGVRVTSNSSGGADSGPDPSATAPEERTVVASTANARAAHEGLSTSAVASGARSGR